MKKLFVLSVTGTATMIRLSVFNHIAMAFHGRTLAGAIASSIGSRTTFIFSGHGTICQQNRHSIGQLHAKPKRGHVVDSYQTVSVNCGKCGQRLFRYKKKNGTKSNLVKCYVERIADDCSGVLRDQGSNAETYECPSCKTRFARAAMIRGMPALKLVGGKTRMTKK